MWTHCAVMHRVLGWPLTKTCCPLLWFLLWAIIWFWSKINDFFWPLTFHDTKFLSKTIVFYHLGSINWGKIICLLKSAIHVALFHRLMWMVSPVWGVVQQKAKVETYAFVNFMSACVGTTKPDFSDLKWGNGLLLEINNKTSWKKRFRGLDFWIIRVLCGNNQLPQREWKSGEIEQTVK